MSRNNLAISATNLLRLGAAIFLLACIPSCQEDPKAEAYPTPGEAALDYVQAARFKNLVMEIDYMTGAKPSQTIQRWLRIQVELLLDRKGQITIELSDEIEMETALQSFDIEDAKQFEAEYRNRWTDGDTAIIYTLFLDGHHSGDTESAVTLAQAYSGTAVVLYDGKIRELCTKFKNNSDNELEQDAICPLARTTTWLHEVGHLFGLVDMGITQVTNHADPEHPGHCLLSTCIMNWQNQSTSMFDELEEQLLRGNESALPFGPDCIEDIKAAQAIP